jgi:DNA-binding NarL/FixJ family response regulator
MAGTPWFWQHSEVSNPVRILLADDHAVVRLGLRRALESLPGWEICGEASNGREAVELTKKLKPDVVVMDISMPELNGLEATRQIMKDLPSAEVLICTLHDSEQMVREAQEAGAHGYVLKSGREGDLLVAIQSLSDHKLFFRTLDTPRAQKAASGH